MHPNRDSLCLSAADTPSGMYFLSSLAPLVKWPMAVYGRYTHGIGQVKVSVLSSVFIRDYCL